MASPPGGTETYLLLSLCFCFFSHHQMITMQSVRERPFKCTILISLSNIMEALEPNQVQRVKE